MRYLSSFILACIFISKLVVISGCANIIPPTGGPKDSLPPKLITAEPKDSFLNFKGNKISFTFDEYIDMKDINENLIVSPVPKIMPIVEYRLKNVTIRLKDTLEPNTTYSLNFGKSLRDNNEGNILRNFRYVFSTGTYLDSLQFTGKVIMAATGKIDSTLIVLLHRKMDDSAVSNDRPRYIAKLDTLGNFRFQNLEPGTYALYALKDEGGSHRYMSKAQVFAFADSPVVLQHFTPSVTLYAFSDTSGFKPPKKSTTTGPAPKPKKPDKDVVPRLTVQTSASSGQLDLLGKMELQFPVPYKFFDSNKVQFQDENFKDISHEKYHYVEDTLHRKVTLEYKWPPGSKFHIIAQKDFAEDTLGQKLLKIDTINFQTKKESDYGSLRLRFSNLNLSRNPVLQFVQSDAIKLAVPLTGRDFRQRIFLPGDYDLRILYDDNKNGVWDPGKFFEGHKQPEKVQPIKKKLSVKPNWDNEVDIAL